MIAVSVILPAYHSQRTLGGCLEALARQTFRDFEAIVVDSSSGAQAARETRAEVEAYATRVPGLRLERSPRRLLPHGARNRGVEVAQGEILAFSDPDVYAAPDWLERLLAAHLRTGEPVVGALACHGGRWLDQGIHLCKFSKWLPGGPPREVDMSPTANMLLSRRQFLAAGGFPGEHFLGDVSLSRALRRDGRRLELEPRAVVAHHHLQSPAAFLAERAVRGSLFGELRLGWKGGGRATALRWLAVTALPVRLPRILALVALHAFRAGWGGRYLAALPVVAAGHAASLAGESLAYARALLGPARSAGKAGDFETPVRGQ